MSGKPASNATRHAAPTSWPGRLRAPALALLVLLAACAETPQKRIDKHPDIFAGATPEQQALIRKGDVAIGFSMDLVRLALGEPSRVTTRVDQHGTQTIWHYVEIRETGPTYGVFGNWGYPAWGFYNPGYYGSFWGGYSIVQGTEYEQDRLRVTFTDGKASVIEKVEKP